MNNTALLKRYYEAFNRGDNAAMLDLLADDVLHEPSQGVTREGKEAFSTFLSHMNECYREQVMDPVFLASDDGVSAAAEFMLEGTYLRKDGDLPSANGQTYQLRVGAFFVICEGRIARVSNHYNLASWLAQLE